MYNAMTEAFFNAAYANKDAYLTSKCRPSFKEGWNLSASFKTYQQLKHQGYVK
jgi:hypothetical protein